MLRVGVDVGGTNTDAVLVDGGTVLAAVKASTTGDVTTGIVNAITDLRERGRVPAAHITAVVIGTTHFTNALAKARSLAPTAAIRFGLPSARSLPPYVDWPSRLLAALGGRSYLCHGGHEFDGREVAPFDEAEFRAVLEEVADAGVRAIAISSVFSPINADFETRAAEIIAQQLPDVSVSLSHEIGRTGLLGRENATIINASLRELADRVAVDLNRSVRDAGIEAPVFLSQNDGTLRDIDYARRYPIATFASGATNSMRGAAFLTGLESCAVVDVGGTTTDVGVLHLGFPRETTAEVRVAGVRTNFRMPDLLSVDIGGGSHVLVEDGQVRVGPGTVGHRIREEAHVFGGDQLTVTDVAVAAGLMELGDGNRVPRPATWAVRAALDRIAARIGEALERIRVTSGLIPVVAVGGAGVLVPADLIGASAVVRPEHHAVANAIGAAIAQVGGEVDRVISVDPRHRDSVVDDARQEAVDRAVAAGARPDSVSVVDVEEIPLAYQPGNAMRLRVKAVGDLALGRGSRS